MNELATIDFETRSEADLKKVGAWRYSIDPSTEVMVIAYKLVGETTKFWSPFNPDDEFQELPHDLIDVVMKNSELFEAHNSFFEYCIWNNVLVKYGFPRLEIERLRDSAAIGSALALPRTLEGVGKALSLPIQKDIEGHKLMMKMSKPRKTTKKNPDKWVEGDENFRRLFEYCVRDVEAEAAASKAMRPLPPKEEQVFLLDQKINLRGVPIDRRLAEKAQLFLIKFSQDLEIRLMRLTDMAVTTGTQNAKLLEWLEGRGVILPNMQSGTVEEILKEELDDDVREVLEIRTALSKASIKKLPAMLRCLDPRDNRVRGTLLYHGASTGRWSGKLIQPQNFPRGTMKEAEFNKAFEDLERCSYEEFKELYPNMTDAISSMLRGFIAAPEGKTFRVCDFSSIESRKLFWLADETSGLEVYHTHGKIYEDMASSIYNCRIDQIASGSFERQLGKQAVLGCGYGMGHKKFQETCEGYGMAVTPDMAKHTVSTFRSKYENVVSFWYELEACAVKAVKNPGRVYATSNGKIAYKVGGGFLWCRLPSGRLLAYKSPLLKMKETPWGELKAVVTFMGVNSQTRRWERQHTYGGKLCENVTQAAARDAMVDAMFRVEAKGYSIVGTVHDELIAEDKEGFGSLEEFEKLMAIPPTWAPDCPIAVEGWEGKRYKK